MQLLIVQHQLNFLCGRKTCPEEYFRELVFIILVSSSFLKYSNPLLLHTVIKLPSLLHSSPACGKRNSELRLSNIDTYKTFIDFTSGNCH